METALYECGVPICVERLDERSVKRKPPATQDQVRSTLIQSVIGDGAKSQCLRSF
jgi:hypothetical protein